MCNLISNLSFRMASQTKFTYQSPPKKQRQESPRSTVTFSVKNLSDVITKMSPKKGANTKWFQCAAVNDDRFKRCVSFYPPLHKKLLESNNKDNLAVKLEKVLESDGEYKLDAETRFVESISFQKPYSFLHKKITPIENLIYKRRFIPLLLAVFFATMWKPCQRN